MKKIIFWNINYCICLSVTIIAFAINGSSQTVTNNYVYDSSDFPNPERGFYHQQDTHNPGYWDLSLPQLQGYKSNENISLILRVFYLEGFQNGPISAFYLNKMTADFNIIRQAGMKCLIRIIYTNSGTAPYGDAPKNIVLDHIAQLKPILIANMDVIAFVQAGFVGSWGEWYLSDFFGDGSQGPLTAQNIADRYEITDSLINAFGRKRFVQIRTPYYINDMLGITTNDTLSYANAFGTTDEALFAHHNDCFLSSSSDYGTYTDSTTQKPYLAYNTRYLPIGGEICNYDPAYGDCTPAQHEMTRMHWTFLNRDYNNTVHNQWISQGCFNDVKKQLGYRFKLVKSVYNDQIIQGNQLSIYLKIFNEGYASVMNKKNVEVILKNTATQTEYSILDQQIDPRHWKAGDSITINKNYGIGNNLPNGSYKLYLKLGDESSSINAISDYAIHFSNQNVWDAATGYNELGTVNINSNGNPGTPYTGIQWFGYSTTGVQAITFQQNSYMQLFPNPANDGTTVIFFSNKNQACEISIADLLGQEIYNTIVAASEKYNELFIPIDNEKFLSGVYFISVKGDDFIQTKRLTVLKK